ncbi:MAG: methyltransferase domain-containing protein [Pseudomonadota bacterium]|nr:methyltransferase domain-containing protein [Pseudomonadota bacterium]
MLRGNWLKKSKEAGELLSQGQFERSIIIYEEIARVYPQLLEAHNNLGVALRASGRVTEAIKSYRRAIKIDSKYLIGRKNLTRALWEVGKIDEALENYTQMLNGSDPDSQLILEAVLTINSIKFSKPSGIARRLLLLLFTFKDIDRQRLAYPAIKLIEIGRRFEKTLAFSKKDNSGKPRFIKLIADDLSDQLLTNILTWTIIPSVCFEEWAVLARHELLFSLNRGDPINIDVEKLWALTLQFQLTEFVQEITSQELALAKKLKDSMDFDDEKALAIVAMYIPLNEINSDVCFWEKLYKSSKSEGRLKISVEREVFNREIENTIKKEITSLTPIEDTVSELVKNQYENNPYPRWLTVESTKAKQTFATKIRNEVQNFSQFNLNLENPDILIAGCGTGRHALSTASRYLGSKVMAIDLSRASIAFAIRQTESYGLANLNFHQADILKLGGLKKRFDVIEVSGVLHHMEKPLLGWEILRGLMKSNGLMRVGLYSVLAREKWSNLRTSTPKKISNAEIQSFIREARIKMIKQAKIAGDQSLFDIADFFSVSGCRDFLFHEKEVQFTIKEIKSCLAKLKLKFLGFVNLSETTKANFYKEFGKKGNLLDLNQWERFEEQFPATFITMYQFWCQDISQP